MQFLGKTETVKRFCNCCLYKIHKKTKQQIATVTLNS